MPSEIAQQIVNQIFGGEKADAVDSINDALAAASYEAIQAQKLEFAKSMGFDLGDTAQDAADEIADALPDGDEYPEDVETEGRMPHDPPESEIETETEEETDDETNR